MKAEKIELGLNSRLKLNDWEIREHISSFTYLDKEGNIKQKKRSFTPFNVPKNSRLKGFNLCERKDKNGERTGKDFCVHYKFNGVSKYHMFGRFKLGIYGIKQAQDDLIEISKKHTDEDLKWIRDPNITKKEKRTKATLDQIEESQKKTLGEVIEVVCIKNFNEKLFPEH